MSSCSFTVIVTVFVGTKGTLYTTNTNGPDNSVGSPSTVIVWVLLVLSNESEMDQALRSNLEVPRIVHPKAISSRRLCFY